MRAIVLLTISNIFMTITWYGHLRFKHAALWKVILISWLIAFVEYCFQVPANRIGSYTYSTAQLKTIQEIITLVVLGGVSITGGKGTVWGVFLGSLLVGYLKFGMGLMKVSGTLMTIVIGSLLIVAVLLPRLLDLYKANRKLRRQHEVR